ncbi:MAG: PH domain-containing protein [Candidatus Korarchaeota archaeon]|nr:PH domain-containing protein [Candidatus Korarchaeota archaeon]NIU84552.1 PH domain-containing protein [Candidatus Thorarchaeota archaeon]NIW14619.1 PH domain-containing protein [Candidatus Thorarchaeota archaeon]NIW52692.1 PH domain-containing protein [Candidatus Korarchaeota archaeon]
MTGKPESFQPDPRMKKLYFTYLSLPAIVILLFLVLPLSYFVGFYLFLLWIYIPLLVLFAGIAVWIPKFYSSLSYSLAESHLAVEEGVIFKKQKRIPLKQITNAEVRRGPFKRRYGIANINIQTAGRSQAYGSEAVLRALQAYDEIDKEITRRIEKLETRRMEAKEEVGQKLPQEAILQELRDMKKILTEIAESL